MVESRASREQETELAVTMQHVATCTALVSAMGEVRSQAEFVIGIFLLLKRGSRELLVLQKVPKYATFGQKEKGYCFHIRSFEMMLHRF